MDIDLVHLEAILSAKENHSRWSFRSNMDSFHATLSPVARPTHSKKVAQPRPNVISHHRKPHHGSVKLRLGPLLPTPPLSMATVNLFSSRNIVKSCPAIIKNPILKQKFLNPRTTHEKNGPFKQATPTSVDSWTTILPKSLKSNLSKLNMMKVRDFINLRLSQLKKGGMCFNCLSKGHLCSKCTKPIKCLVCNTAGHGMRSCSMLPLPATDEVHPKPQILTQLAPPQTPLQPLLTDTTLVPPPVSLITTSNELNCPTSQPNSSKTHPSPAQETSPSCDSVASQDRCVVLENFAAGSSTAQTGRVHFSSQFRNGHIQSNGQCSQVQLQISRNFSWGQQSLLLAASKDNHTEPFFSLLILKIPFVVPTAPNFSLLRSFQYLSGRDIWATALIEREDFHVDVTDWRPRQLDFSDRTYGAIHDLDPLQPPGFESTLGFFNNPVEPIRDFGSDPLEPPGFERATRPVLSPQPIRRSPRLLSKITGPYISALDKAQLTTHGVIAPSIPRKNSKKTKARPDLRFMKESGPINRDQARSVVLEAGFDLTEDILAILSLAGIVPLP